MAEKTRRKLLLNEKVEVRSGEDGFLGSWHSGKVIGFENLVRVVVYDHLLNDEGSCCLIDRVTVSPAVEGVVTSKGGNADAYRGFIRPLPPSNVLGLSVLHYGQCVDMFYADAWWEGVVFDHEDGCDQRRIFFPDLGDEMEAEVHLLRSSRDWDEVTEEWKPRGNWLFLEIMEELKQDCLLPVSLKQIWYEVRMKNDFEKLSEWTSSIRHIWKELVTQVLLDNLRITVKHFFKEMNSSWNSSGLGRPFLKFSERVFDDVLKNEGLFCTSLVDVPFEATSQLDGKEILSSDNYERVHEHSDEVPKTDCVSEQARSLSLSTFPVLSIVGFESCNQAPERNFQLGHVDCTTQKSTVLWQSVVPQLISGAEFCPADMDECVKMIKSDKRPSNTAVFNARKHLLYLNWKVQFMEDLRCRFRFRYFSPDGELFDSFRQVCLNFDCESQDLEPASQMNLTDGRNFSLSSIEEMPSIGGNSQCSKELSNLCSPSGVQLLAGPEYCPEAIASYCSICLDKNGVVPRHEKKMKALKAKKHLSSSGWSFDCYGRGKNRRPRYISPNGAVFYSLCSACKWCIESGALTCSELYPTAGRIENVNAIEDFNDHTAISESHHPLPVGSMESLSLENGNPKNRPNESSDVSVMEGLVRSSEGEVCKARILRKRGNCCIEGPVLPRRGRKPRALMEITEDMHACSSTPVRRSNKRVGDAIACSRAHVRRSSKKLRDMISCSSTPVRRSSKRVRNMIASSSQKTPRTVLSWLIDNNVVLPRSKVRYLGRSNGVPMKEGRIAREGIKCSCCGETYSISKFEAHAGSTNHRPSANIFLEDGRSLLECQLQLKEQKDRGFRRSQSHERNRSRRNKKNDYICSICHYGGELLLCDQCPSAFHIHCLGLKGVPDGDWFCPSCCCQICRQGPRRNRQDADSSVLICDQCEHRYHVECLIVKGIVSIDYHPQGYWFCQDTCKQIFYGLRKILGKPIPVGTDNLTWTLVKYIKSDSYDPNSCEDVLDNYSKLNVALSVMHECFEPVREPATRRDLVEDVIFSRWSELHRLNFQGFYTVLLEKNDELISAATVRIYGKRVAEVPLVATRFQYRRLGMCRVLMNALEKNLVELGVERLVLPAVPSVLNTWTTSFGFSVMNASDRLNFLDNIFLDFQGTVTCQKILVCNPSLTLSPSTRTQVTSRYQVNKNLNIELDRSSTVSEVVQVDQVTMTDISDHGSMGIAMGATGADNKNGNCSDKLAIVVHVDESTTPTCLPFRTTISLDCPVSIADGKESDDTGAGLLKCYKRRRISAC